MSNVTASPSQHLSNLHFVVPVLDDWDSLDALARNLRAAVPMDCWVYLVVVDDGSVQAPNGFAAFAAENISVEVVKLGVNLGHQRAIAVGLCHVASLKKVECVIVMDADGEDRPHSVIDLLWAHTINPESIVVAQRQGRTEALKFRAFYRQYKLLFKSLTGNRLDFGNFVALPPSAVQRLVLMNELWNHFPAAIMRSRLPIVKIPIDRGVRYSGESRMNFTALVNHGLAAIAAFIDAVFVRLLVLTGVLLGLFSLAAVAVIAIRVWGTWGVPGWATTALGLILLGLLQLVGLLVVVTFLTLSMRSSSSPPPIQFAQQYITRVEKIS